MKGETLIEQIMFSTVRIQAYLGNDEWSIGTGFIVSHKVCEGCDRTFLVTNRHVIQGAISGRFALTQSISDDPIPALGNTIKVALDPIRWAWICHPSPDIDVAVLPLDPIFESLDSAGHSCFVKSIPTDFCPTQGSIAEFDAVEEVLFVGYPNGIYDSANNLPIARRGITATALSVDYEGRPVFLIDASVFPGSSGSPVFLYSPSARLSRQGAIGRRQFHWLGIVAEVFFEEEFGFLDSDSMDVKIKTKQMIDLGIVFKARVVVEAIEYALHADLESFRPL